MIIGYTVPETWRVTDVIVIFHFGVFFSLVPPANLPKNQIKTNEKKNAWRYDARRTDGRADGKSDI